MELRRATLVVLGSVALLASSCSGSSSVAKLAEHVTPATAVFAKGGTVTVAVPYLPTNFNPSTLAGANAVTQMVMEQVWPQAFVTDSNYQSETTGFIDSAEVVGLKPMTVNYVIDPQAKWSDGHPITVNDFEYNWRERMLYAGSSGSVGSIAGYRDIRSIKGSKGGKLVTVVFKRPYADWEGLFANLVPAHIGERWGWARAFAGFQRSRVISGGPFIVSTVVPGKRLVLTRNPSYWGNSAHLQRIVFVVEHSAQGVLAGLKSGSLSIGEVSTGPSAESAVARHKASSVKLTLQTTPSRVLWQLVFNLNSVAVSSRVMRLALALDTDRDELVADSVGLEDPSTLASDSAVSSGAVPGSGARPVSASAYDPNQATALFRSLGYVADDEGVLRSETTGSQLTLTITGPKGDAVVEMLEEQLQAEWAACGISLIIHNVPMAELLDGTLPRGEYQLALAPYPRQVFASWNAIVYTDPVLSTASSIAEQASESDSSLAGTSSVTLDDAWLWGVATVAGTEPGAATLGAVTRDVTGLDDPAVVAEFEKVLSELSVNTEARLLIKLNTLLSTDLPVYPLYDAPVSLVHRSDIVNVSESPTPAGPMWDAEDWAVELATGTP